MSNVPLGIELSAKNGVKTVDDLNKVAKATERIGARASFVGNAMNTMLKKGVAAASQFTAAAISDANAVSAAVAKGARDAGQYSAAGLAAAKNFAEGQNQLREMMNAAFVNRLPEIKRFFSVVVARAVQFGEVLSGVIKAAFDQDLTVSDAIENARKNFEGTAAAAEEIFRAEKNATLPKGSDGRPRVTASADSGPVLAEALIAGSAAAAVAVAKYRIADRGNDQLSEARKQTDLLQELVNKTGGSGGDSFVEVKL